MSINSKVKSFIINKFFFGDAGQLSDETPLLEKHIVDSTGVLEIVAFLEEAYGIRVEDEELVPENLNSIESISRFVENKRSVSAQ